MTHHFLDDQNSLRNVENMNEVQRVANSEKKSSGKQRRTFWRYIGAGVVAASFFAGALSLPIGTGSVAAIPESHKAYATAQQNANTTAQQDVINIKTHAVSASDYVSVAREAAVQNGISPDLFVRQIQQESGFNPNAQSWAGAIGIAQFMPGTAAAYGVNPYDPIDSLYGAARHMADLNAQYGGDYAKALAAYNAGPGNVNAAVNAGGSNWRAYLPSETQHYLSVILG